MRNKATFLQLLKQEYACRLDKGPWHLTARTNQLLPQNDAWLTWLIMAGRGFGKTRTGAESLYHLVRSGMYRNIALIGKSQRDVRSVMLYGESGLLTIQDKRFQARYFKSEGRILWPNGAQAHLLGGDYIEALRGFQFDFAWVDELAKFRDPAALWQQLMFCLRLGKKPRCIVTTTPKPSKFLLHLSQAQSTHLTMGSSYENKANLAPTFFEQVVKPYHGTKLGQQEIDGLLLMHDEGAMWTHEMFKYKTTNNQKFIRTLIAVDPAVTSHEKSDETGIVVIAKDEDGCGWVLEDKLTPMC